MLLQEIRKRKVLVETSKVSPLLVLFFRKLENYSLSKTTLNEDWYTNKTDLKVVQSCLNDPKTTLKEDFLYFLSFIPLFCNRI